MVVNNKNRPLMGPHISNRNIKNKRVSFSQTKQLDSDSRPWNLHRTKNLVQPIYHELTYSLQQIVISKPMEKQSLMFKRKREKTRSRINTRTKYNQNISVVTVFPMSTKIGLNTGFQQAVRQLSQSSAIKFRLRAKVDLHKVEH